MYYDASRPSGLERILSDSPLLNAPDMLARARALREAMLPLYARPVPERDPEAAAMLEELDRADAAPGRPPPCRGGGTACSRSARQGFPRGRA